jgi:hypothetical protein
MIIKCVKDNNGNYYYYYYYYYYWGHAVAQLIEVLWYKPEGRGFDSKRLRWSRGLRAGLGNPRSRVRSRPKPTDFS